MESRLTLRGRLLLRLHLRACAACARYKAQLKLLRITLRRGARSLEGQGDSDLPTLAPNARARLKLGLRRDSSCGAAGTEDDGPR